MRSDEAAVTMKVQKILFSL